MSYANDILAKCENAAVAMLLAAVAAETLTLIPAASVFHGFGDNPVVLPRVVCACNNAVVDAEFDGNWMVDLDIEVCAAFADTTRDEFHALCGEVWAHFQLAKDTVNANLSNADDPFTAFAVYPRRQSRSLEPGANGDQSEWSVKFSFSVKCCGSVIA